MELKKLLFTVLCVFLYLKGFSGNPPIIDTHSIHLQCNELLRDDRTLRFKTHFFNSLILINDSVGYYNPVGTLHLFQIHFDSVPEVVLLKDSPYNGHNFSRNLFLYKNNLYSLGGVGLFNTNSELLMYDFIKNEWFETKIIDLPDHTSIVITSWLDENRLYTCYVLNGEKRDILFGYVNMDSLNFHLLNQINHLSEKDLHTVTQGVEIHQGEIFNVIEIHGIENNCVYRLFNKVTGELLKVSFLKDRPCIDGNSYVYTKDSTIYYRFENGTIDSVEIDETTVYYQNSFKELFLSKPNTKFEMNLWWVLIGFLIIPIFSILFFRFRKKESKIEIEKNEEITEIEGRLQEYINKIISRDELDDILRISHYSFETIKKRRSLLINQINERNVLIVERFRKQDDKRYFEYKITKS